LKKLKFEQADSHGYYKQKGVVGAKKEIFHSRPLPSAGRVTPNFGPT
jgi:hypothetical protein